MEYLKIYFNEFKKMMNTTGRFLALVMIALIITTSCEELGTGPDTGDSRDRLTGTWECAESSESFGNQQYTVEIRKSFSDTTSMFIDDLYVKGSNVRIVLDERAVSVSPQSSKGHQFSGYGTVFTSYERIQLYLKIDDGSGLEEDVSADLRKL
ncbi:MAG: hypothetical protein ACOCXW_01140 [Bacteroidota bacterium]